MQKKLIPLLILLFFVNFTSYIASAQEPLAWKNCVEETKKNNPSLASASEELKQAVADKVISQTVLLPQITSSASTKRSRNPTSGVSDTYTYGVTGTQLLFDGLKAYNDLQTSSATLKASEYNYAVSSSNIRLSLRTAFVQLLRAQDLVSLTEQIAQRRKQNLQLIQLRYQAGREHRGSLLTAEADLAQADFEVAQAKRNLSLSQRRLSKEMGRQDLTPINIKEDFNISEKEREEPDFESMADNTPLLKELIAKKEAKRFGLKSAKSDFFPQIYLNTSTGMTAADWPPDRNDWSIGASVSFPLFEGGSRVAKVTKAKAGLNQAEFEERSGRDDVIFTLQETWTSLQDALDEYAVREKFLAAAKERAKIADSQYSSGLLTFDDWTIIQDNLVAAEKNFLNIKSDALVAEAAWIQAKGGTLDYDK